MWTLLTCLTFLTIQANSQNSFSKHNPNAEHISKTSQRIKEITASLPLSFEANRGQVDSHIKFLSRGDGYNLLLAANEVTFNLSNSKLRMQFIGANQTPKLRGLERLPGHSNYFIGNDQSRWQSNVPNFSRVEYVEIYRGINLIFYGQQRQLEYDFVVQPGADPNKIKFSFEGYQRIKLDQAGNLVLETNDGQVIQHKPVVYQEINGVKQLIPSKYILDAKHRISFHIEKYDHGVPLVIDPVISFSSLLAEFKALAMALDPAGNIYLTGASPTSSFPVSSTSYKRTLSSGFVLKLNPDATALIYSTFIGGSENIDYPYDIAVDAEGNAYLTGMAASQDFPTTPGAFQTKLQSPGQTNNGFFTDAFVTKLNPSGSALVYSTILGGSNSSDVAYGVAVNSAGEAFVTGSTLSTNFPVTPNSAQPFKADFFSAGFVTRLNASGSELVYSTYFGQRARHNGQAIAVDAEGNAYVTGESQPDILILKLNQSGSTFVYQKKLSGGGAYSEGFDVIADSQGNAFVTGRTGAQALPTTTNAFQKNHGGGNYDAFAAKLGPTGDTLYLTYLGGSGSDEATGLALDANGNLIIVGTTDSTNFPTVAGAIQPIKNQLLSDSSSKTDVFITKLNSNGTGLVHSTYLGSSESDSGNDVATDSLGRIYVMGNTTLEGSAGVIPFPRTDNTLVSRSRSSQGTFIMRLDESTNSSTDLALSVERSGELVASGFASYQFKITNTGTTKILNGVRLNVQLPDNVTFAGMYGEGWIQPQFYGNNFPALYLGPLGSGEQTVLTVEVRAGSTGSVTTTAKIENPNDLNPANNSVSDTTTIIQGCPFFGLFPSLPDGQPGKNFSWTAASSSFTVTSSSSCAWQARSNAPWIKVTSGSGSASGTVAYEVTANTSNKQRTGTISVSGQAFRVNQDPYPPTASISAASYKVFGGRLSSLAAESIVSVFGINLATATEEATSLPLPTTLAGTTIKVRDFFGIERLAPLFYVSPLQVNYQIPEGTSTGEATLTITNSLGEVTTETIQVVPVMPGVFTANSNGQDVPAALIQRVKADGTQRYEPVFEYSEEFHRYIPKEIDFGPDLGANSDQLYLVLFGTGIRGRSSLNQVTLLTYRGAVAAQYAGAQGQYQGLDQANFLLPRSLAGTQTTFLSLLVDGLRANEMQIRFK